MHVVGARPNFMKIAPVMHEMSKHPQNFQQILVHTGQHYNANMSQIFFDELGLPQPDINLEVGSGTHATQTSQIMLRFEPVVQNYEPDWVIVPGDVNSALACALVCSKLGIKVAHVEAGLRSFDRTMPEEINRLIIDQIADLLFTPSKDADNNLLNEGIAAKKICFVGNVMIDTLIRLKSSAMQRWNDLQHLFQLQSQFLLVTLHRPSNVDDPSTLQETLLALKELSQKIKIIFPVHPRTRQRIEQSGITANHKNILYTEPLGYLDFLALESHAALVITDSGGVQEETTYLGTPCLTIRPNTERPVTIEQGTNRLISSHNQAIVQASVNILDNPVKYPKVPDFWDGQASSRIVSIFQDLVAM